MEVKPVNTVPTYQVKASTEASEEERRQRRGNEQRSMLNPPKKLSKPAFNKQFGQLKEQDHPPDPQDSDIGRQVVDSSKVIQLLSQKPKISVTLQKRFVRAAVTPKSALTSKKMNKVL